MDENIVFGPALLEAALLEKDEAVYPRVILGENAARLMLSHLEYYANGYAPQIQAVLVDEDNKYFVNYLRASIDLLRSYQYGG